MRGLPNYTGDSWQWKDTARFGGGGDTTTTQKADPWSGQQPYLKDVFSQAQGLYNNNNPQYYPFSTVAPMNGMQAAGLQGVADVAGSQQPAISAGTNQLSSTLNGDYLSAGNPYFQNMANSVMSTVMPQIQSQFAGGNRMNSGLAAQATGAGVGQAIGNLAYQNYGDERTNQLKGLAAMPTTLQAAYQPSNALLAAGTQAQNQSQNQLTDMVNRWNYQQQLPYQKLQNYSSMIQGQYGGTTTTSQPYQSNTAANILGAASSILPFFLL